MTRADAVLTGRIRPVQTQRHNCALHSESRVPPSGQYCINGPVFGVISNAFETFYTGPSLQAREKPSLKTLVFCRS